MADKSNLLSKIDPRKFDCIIAQSIQKWKSFFVNTFAHLSIITTWIYGITKEAPPVTIVDSQHFQFPEIIHTIWRLWNFFFFLLPNKTITTPPTNQQLDCRFYNNARLVSRYVSVSVSLINAQDDHKKGNMKMNF